MITLDLDLAYLSSYYHIGTNALEQYKNKSITQIMEIEAAKGNAKAAEFLLRAVSDPKELANVFQLINPKNRYLILRNMNKEDLCKVIEKLDTDQIVLGLSIFTQEALCQVMMLLEPETLATLVLKNMDADKFIKMLPEDYLNEFLASDKIDRNVMMKAMEDVDEEHLQKMIERMTGQPCYDDKDNILQKVGSLDDDEFLKTVFSMDIEGKQQLIENVLSIKPELFEEFSPEAMVFPFQKMQKEDVLKALTVLEPKDFMPMMEELPQEVLALIATQIKPEDFAQILCSDFADVIAQCGAA